MELERCFTEIYSTWGLTACANVHKSNSSFIHHPKHFTHTGVVVGQMDNLCTYRFIHMGRPVLNTFSMSNQQPLHLPFSVRFYCCVCLKSLNSFKKKNRKSITKLNGRNVKKLPVYHKNSIE